MAFIVILNSDFSLLAKQLRLGHSSSQLSLCDTNQISVETGL